MAQASLHDKEDGIMRTMDIETVVGDRQRLCASSSHIREKWLVRHHGKDCAMRAKVTKPMSSDAVTEIAS